MATARISPIPFLLVLGLLAHALALAPVQAQALGEACRVFANSSPPLSIIKNGKVTGFSIELLSEILAEAGEAIEDCEVSEVPWARGLQEVRKNKSAIMFSVARTPEREHLFEWVGPFYRVEMSLIARKDSQFKPDSPSDLTVHQTCVLQGSAPEEILIGLGVPKNNLYPVPDAETCIKLLKYGRIDFFAHVFAMFAHEAALNEVVVADFESVYSLGKTELFFALNKNAPTGLLSRMQKALAQHISPASEPVSPFYRSLLSRHGL